MKEEGDGEEDEGLSKLQTLSFIRVNSYVFAVALGSQNLSGREAQKEDMFSEIENRSPGLSFASIRVHSRLLLVILI